MLLRRQLLKVFQNSRSCYTVVKGAEIKENPVSRQMYSHIKSCGPISISNYMKEVLVNPTGGYYMHRDVFGKDGDFVTSPELGQMFGEMVAVWLLNEWSKLGCPKPVQIVELGPGKGTLSQDILRVFEHFKALQGTTLHLVEVSPHLSSIQAQTLCMQSENIPDKNSVIYRQGIAHQGIPVKWYHTFEDVPDAFTLLIAHEFFDALPIHKFQRTQDGYREVLVDIDPTKDLSFRYVLARNPSPVQNIIIQPNESREHVEVSLDSLLLIKKIAKKLDEHGGMALIADYGHDGSGTDTFRAFKKHKIHDPLVEPGTADLTADVDFARLREVAIEDAGIISFGPVNQREFLLKIGIEHRYKKLAEVVKGDQLEALKFGYNMIVDEDKMGKRFKFLSLFPQVLEDFLKTYPPVGFG